MNKEQELKNKIAKDQMKYVIKLMKIAKEKGKEEAKEDFNKKLEQLEKKPQKVYEKENSQNHNGVSSFDEHKAHLINEINKIIDNIEKELPYGLNMSIQDFKGELKKKIEELRK